MIDKLIGFSIHNKLVIGLFVLALVVWGSVSFRQIPLDAVPDITTNQAQVITQSPTLAAQEVEQFITFPIEVAMANLPGVTEIRSISRFGISVVTIVFEEKVDIYRARQLISEQLKTAQDEIPDGFGNPELGPITTGLGEVYQYILHADEGYESQYTDMDLRTINDWIVRRQLAGTPGVIEVSGWGGHLKQYEVAVNPEQLNSMNISITEVFEALEANNENTGGSYIEKRYNSYFIRGEGIVKSIDDIEKIVVKTVNGIPVFVRDIAEVGFGSAPRYGAITWNGNGEVVGGQALMLKGENSYKVVQAVKERIETIRTSLPEGVVLEPFIDRSNLIDRAITTVKTNLLEGGMIVVLILVLLLGNFRGGLIVASVIPLSMLFAMGMMNLFGVSANLMSLGAIDFGLVVDGSVIIVEAILFQLSSQFKNKQLTPAQMDIEVNKAASRIRNSAAFGEIIILIVYLPILALVGVEGKMFKPMAQTVGFAIAGALILSMTYVPMMSALFLNRNISDKKTISDRVINKLQQWYKPLIFLALKRKAFVLVLTISLFAMSLFTFNRMGGEFLPTLEEGDMALHQILPPGSSLQQSVEVSEKIQNALLDNFPEILMVVSKIGTSEIPTDPMPIEVGDIMVKMKPKEEWVSAKSKEEMFEKMEKVLAQIPGVQYEFTQPIQMRFNELIAGVREDIAIKIFGENPDVLFQKAQQVEKIITGIHGIGDLRVEQTQGLPQIMVVYERNKIAQYGLNIRELNQVLRTAFAGEKAGVVFEEERRFDLTVRLGKEYRNSIDDIRNLFVPLPNGHQIPLKEVAKIDYKIGPTQISRDNAKRRIVIGVNARNRDIESLVEEIRQRLSAELELPPGYYLSYGGQFENLVAAKERLAVAVPVALLLIFILLFLTFKSVKQALLIFTAIPLSAIGGVYALWIRDMPFSISAGVGFIALFGVAVLNGIVLIGYFNQLKKEGVIDIKERIIKGAIVRLRPVLMTATVAAFGFLPMALSSSSGAEVQRPLATVVIGGLISATLLTLLVLPVLYSIFEQISFSVKPKRVLVAMTIIAATLTCNITFAQGTDIPIDEAVTIALKNHPIMKNASLGVKQQQQLKKGTFDLGNTTFSYTVGQLNASVTDYQWQISQEFKFPTTYLVQGKLQDRKIELSEHSQKITALELEKNVRAVWWQLAYHNAQKEVVSKLALIYADFKVVAEKRYEAGETNLLEKINAEGQYQKMLLQVAQVEADVRLNQEKLQQWLTQEIDIAIPVKWFKKMNVDVLNSSDINSNPNLGYFMKNIEVNGQEVKLKKTGLLPNFKIGYLNQQIEGIKGMEGLQIGVGVPLFFWTQQGKIKAAVTAAEMAQLAYDNEVLMLNANHQIKIQELKKRQKRLEWFELQGLKMANELLRFAKKGYDAGEIGYVEYMNSINQATTIELDYLSAIHEHNQAVMALQYLKGKFND